MKRTSKMTKTINTINFTRTLISEWKTDRKSIMTIKCQKYKRSEMILFEVNMISKEG